MNMELVSRGIQCFKDNGARYTIRRTLQKIWRIGVKGEKTYQGSYKINNKYCDVLFINGCDVGCVPHPYRYRVLHQIEQLLADNISSEEVYYLQLDPEMVYHYHVLVLYRCPYTETVGKAISIAKQMNKRVLFDVDDLVISTEYTNNIPYIQKMPKREKALYDEGVKQMGKTLALCDAAVTTTEALEKELKKYVPTVYINRNCASEEMMQISDRYLNRKGDAERCDVIMGYFSGSITHNADFEMIKDVVIRILREYDNTILMLMGELEIPSDLAPFGNRIIVKPFADWKELIGVIGRVDINLVPLEKNLFNEAKSENKWVEASIVQVVTVASKCGAFEKMIKHGETGYLCSSKEEWYNTLSFLVRNPQAREAVAKRAYSYCKDNCTTVRNSAGVGRFIRSIRTKNVAIVLPGLQISGGVMVALKHAVFLREKGWDVDIFIYDADVEYIEFSGLRLTVVPYLKRKVWTHYDLMIATMWSTLNYVQGYTNANNKAYLVQSYETEFYTYGDSSRRLAESTYSAPGNIQYITISKWCEEWLRTKYGKKAQYVPNGLQGEWFNASKRDFSRNKLRILIEGDCQAKHKNVDESFRITQSLDSNRFEIWFLSYSPKPKSWYRFDKFFSRVSYEQVGRIYESCDILLKSSRLESFSYPPLEMMATGGYCVVVPNEGNIEYLVNESNCLFYESGNVESGIDAINRICEDAALRDRLYLNGLETAKQRDWKALKDQIVDMYMNIGGHV